MMSIKKNDLKKWPGIITVILLIPILISWGSFAHEHINRAAVLALPEPLQLFFYNHIDFITQESTIPDVRKYALNDKAEDPRHYFDLENYGTPDSIPVSLVQARQKYDDNFLQQNGILPWYIEEMMDKLTKAFKEKKRAEILFLAADLGHYIADAHTPLHTTVNYDGQLTNQKGIHALWESQIVKLFGDEYNYFSNDAVYIDDVHKEIWRIINESNALVDTLLRIDRELRQQRTPGEIYQKDSLINSKPLPPSYLPDYARLFHQKLNGMVEKQLKRSISAVASFWYTAWVNAGKPDLSDLDPKGLAQKNRPMLKKEIKLFRKGKLSGI